MLHIGTSDTATPFLAEKDIPKDQRIMRHPSNTSELEDRQLAEAIAKSEQQPQSPRQPPAVQPPHESSQPSSSSPQQQFSEEDIHRITTVGFTRQQAIDELRRTQGNVELALGSLLARSLKF